MTSVRRPSSHSILLELIRASAPKEPGFPDFPVALIHTSLKEDLDLVYILSVALERKTNFLSISLKMVAAMKALVVLALSSVAYGSAIPIWELLTQQEKMGRLMYVFIHLVDQYCKDSSIPDCQKVLTLYGMSNLVNEEENSLDYMDPYQRDSRSIIWEKVMKGDFKLPSHKTFYPQDVAHAPVSASDEDYDLVNEVQDRPYYPSAHKTSNDPHPYAVRVPAPAKIASAYANSEVSTNSHPYAVLVAAPETTTYAPGPVGIKPSADFEPMMAESRISSPLVRRLLPNSNSAASRLLVRSRRSAEVFPEEEMKVVMAHILRK